MNVSSLHPLTNSRSNILNEMKPKRATRRTLKYNFWHKLLFASVDVLVCVSVV